MSLKEQKAAKQAELAALTERVNAADAEAVKAANDLMDEIDGIDAAIAAAEKSNAILASMKTAEKTVRKSGAKSIGELAANSLSEKGWKAGERLNVTTPEFKDADTDTDTEAAGIAVIGGYAETEVTHRVIQQPNRKLVFADLFGAEALSGSSTAKEIIVEKPVTGDFAITEEGGLKPQLGWDYEKMTVSIDKIAGYTKLTDEFMEDAAYLRSTVDNRMVHKLACAEEDYLVSELLDTDGLQAIEYDPSFDKGLAEAVLSAQTKISNNTNNTADAVVLNPADFEALRLAKDSNGQYYGGGYFQNEYGNGGIQAPGSIWGLRVLTSKCVEQGTAIVGDFAGAAAVLRKGGVRVDMTNSNEDDFIHNLVLLRIEERVGLAVYVPAAFVVITATDADTDTDTDTE